MSGHGIKLHPHLIPTGERYWVVKCACGWRHSAVRKKEAAERVWLVHVDSAKPVRAPVDTSCPTPHKKVFRSEATATTYMHQFWRAARGKSMLVRVYECQCGRWHTTSKAMAGAR